MCYVTITIRHDAGDGITCAQDVTLNGEPDRLLSCGWAFDVPEHCPVCGEALTYREQDAIEMNAVDTAYEQASALRDQQAGEAQ